MGETIKTKITSGVLWSVFMRWSMKFIGFINTIILARILAPEDFGLVAMAMLVLGLIEELSTVNVSLLLIRTQSNDRAHNDTAWTVSILQSLVVGLILLIMAPFAADYFDDPRVVEIIHVLIVIKIIMGFQNIGVIIARKELDFAFDYRFMIYTRLATFFSVLSLALIMQNYWAIVFGTLLGETISLALSYIMHSYRPRLCIRHLREYVMFAIPMIPMAIARLLNNKMDVIVVGGNSGTSTMGIYNVANELAATLIKEIVLPTARGLFPNFSRLTSDRAAFIKTYLLTISAAALYCIPAGIGIWFVADELILVILGDQWTEGGIYLKWLALYAALSSITMMMAEHPLIALGMEAWASRIMWLRLSVLSVCVFGGFKLAGIEGIAMGIAASSVITLPLVTGLIMHLLKIEFTVLIAAFIRPAVAGTAMGLTFILSGLPGSLSWGALPDLLVSALLGAVIYALVLLGLWRLSGSRDNIEGILINKVLKR